MAVHESLLMFQPDFYHEKVLKPGHKGQMQQYDQELF
jgi:hypothetical protein